jgi:hypothetical protein
METLSQKRSDWIAALCGDDEHTIFKQLYALTWDSAVFQVINESRRLAEPNLTGGVKLNGLIHEFIDNVFFATHQVRVRKLADPAKLCDQKKGVFSLVSLLTDISEHRQLLTRQAMFDAEGVPYDPSPIEKQAAEFRRHQIDSGVHVFWTPRELDASRTYERHDDIDRLAGVRSSDREPDDVVRSEVIQALADGVAEATSKIKLIVDKCVAHAATPRSRAEKTPLVWPTLHDLFSANQRLCEIASFLACDVLGVGQCFHMPICQFDIMEYIDRPLVDSQQVATLQKYWDDFVVRTQTWSEWRPLCCRGGP